MLAAAARRTLPRGGEAIVVFGYVGPNIQYIHLYVRTDQYINCHKRAGAECMRWRLYIILLYCRFAGKAVPPATVLSSASFASLHRRRRPFRRRGSRTTTMLCTRSRVCVCAYARVGWGATTPKLFSREKAYCVLKNRFYFVLNEYNSAL